MHDEITSFLGGPNKPLVRVKDKDRVEELRKVVEGEASYALAPWADTNS
jgi:hypothetical protein